MYRRKNVMRMEKAARLMVIARQTGNRMVFMGLYGGKVLPGPGVNSARHCEADLYGDLPVLHAALGDGAARLDHLEPAEVLDGLVRALEGLAHGILDRGG